MAKLAFYGGIYEIGGNKVLAEDGGSDLIQLVKEINPEALIPIHSKHPDPYLTPLRGTGISATLPVLEQTLEL